MDLNHQVEYSGGMLTAILFFLWNTTRLNNHVWLKKKCRLFDWSVQFLWEGAQGGSLKLNAGAI